METDTTRTPDPYALAWHASLTTIAAMIQEQDSPLSVRQVEYLRRTLFGGMGSFNDFWIDEKQFGEPARRANTLLGEKHTALFELFRCLAHESA